MQDIGKELKEKADETQADMQAVKTSIDMWTGSLKSDITDTKKDFHEAIANTRNDLHDKLSLMIQGEAQ
jgi:gas vesicle protein